MLKRIYRVVLFAAFILPGLSAWADSHVIYTDDQGKVGDQLYVKDGKVRIEKQGNSSIAIYDPATNSVVVMIPGAKLYFVLNGQSAAQFGAAFQGVMQAHAAQQQAASATGQHSATNGASTSLGNDPAVHTNSQDTMQITERDLGTTEAVLGHTCRNFALSIDGRMIGDYCVVDSAAELGLPEVDLKGLDAMRAGTQRLAGQMGPFGQKLVSMNPHKFFLKANHLIPHNGQLVTSTETLQSVVTTPLDAHIFDIPADYRQLTTEQLVQAMHPKTTAAPAATRP